MREEYDFSKGERGRFYQQDAKMNLPIYLEEEVMVFIEKNAQKKGSDMSSVVNKLLRGDMLISEVME
jgi:hypothetical protein